MTAHKQTSRSGSIAIKITTGVVFFAIVVLLLLWLAGTFHDKVPGGGASPQPGIAVAASVGSAPLAVARIVQLPRTESSVGSIRAVHETSVASKILAKVLEVNVIAGQKVGPADVLVRLDAQDLTARLEQAEAVARSAHAQRDQAKIEHHRIKDLVERQAAAAIEWDRVQTALTAAEAEVARADQAVSEARTVLDYATIRSSIAGVVVDKRVDVGDIVTPGQVLLSVYDPTRMQLVASVRESLTHRLSVGQAVNVRIDALGKTCQGRVSEIVPEAETATRTFLVKVTGPCPSGIYTGMFGRLLVPLDDEAVLVVPQAAIRRVGQLDLVQVARDDTLQRRAVKLGRSLGDDVEVLSGIREGERVALVSGDVTGGGERKP